MRLFCFAIFWFCCAMTALLCCQFSRARRVHSRRVVSRIHFRLIVRVGVMDADILMCLHVSLRLHIALHLHTLFVRDVRIVLRDGGLLIRMLLGVFVFVFVVRSLANLRQRQPQTQTKSKNSFHSVYLNRIRQARRVFIQHS